jgi:capsular polysaccharide export protein
VLLQGPVGPFFARFARALEARGARVSKINFNGGDDLFYRRVGVTAYRGRPEELGPWFAAYLAAARPDMVIAFGDCRPIHKQALAVARAARVAVWIFEEGYLRPDWVTLERDGVNGNSRMPKDPAVYRQLAAPDVELPEAERVGRAFLPLASWASLYAIGMALGRWRYPHYRHHRDFSLWRQSFAWLRSGLRRVRFGIRERRVLRTLQRPEGAPYVVLPLQLSCDAQFEHSPYPDMEAVMREVVASFARWAPGELHLVVKHHPADRAYRDYDRFLAALSARHGCRARVRYVHDVDLPTLLGGARAVVTMNSTTGLLALQLGVPVKTLATAVYDVAGMTYQGQLDAFWNNPGVVDRALVDAFVRYVRITNQVNGSFYVRSARMPSGLAEHIFGPRASGEVAVVSRAAAPATRVMRTATD